MFLLFSFINEIEASLLVVNRILDRFVATDYHILTYDRYIYGPFYSINHLFSQIVHKNNNFLPKEKHLK